MARTESQWQERLGTHIEPTKQGGIDVLIKGLNKYLNFNTTSGTSGYGFRDNNGVIEFKNASGEWGAISDLLSSQTFEAFSKNLKSYPYTITETSSTVTTIEYDIGGGTIIKTITEVSPTVTTIVFSGDYPDGISTTKTITDGTPLTITYS